MKRTTTTLSKGLMLFAVILLIGSASLFGATKRVLLEQQTGAWCGWCPDGTVVMDELIKNNPDKVVGVKWHNGDGMAITEGGQLENAFGVQGWPSGLVDRKLYNNAMVLGRNLWTSAAIAAMQQEPIVDIQLTYSYDQASNTITATITAEVLKDDSRQLAFNVYVMEDYCHGKGGLWDQQNYISGNSSFPGHPYYDLPPTITGYQHMKVVRKPLGGVFGSTEKFPATVKAGDTYTQTFTIQKATAWKEKNLYLVGLVQAFVTQGTTLVDGSILNAVEAGKREDLKAGLSVTKPNVLVTPGTAFNKKVTVSNPQAQEISANMSVANLTSLPSGWTITFSQDNVTIPANGSVDVDVNILAPDGKAGYVDVDVVATPNVASDNYRPIEAVGTVSALTDNTK